MRKLLFFLIALPLLANSQVTENFSDGDFTNNPTWAGETTEFIVNTSFQLQLQATVPYTTPSDTTYLSTSSTSINNTEWQFWVKMSFQTSANNHARFYLVSNQSNLESSLNGYFVQLGDFGDGKDSISLYKQAGTVFTKLISGTVVYTNNSTNFFRVKVTRDNLGNWSLYSDPTGGTNFSPEGATIFDNTFTSSSYSGVFCKYTSSNNTKISFDDIYVGPIIVDITPPTLTSVILRSTNTVDVRFSETVSTATAQTVTNYSVDKSVGNPLSAVKDATNGAIVHLTFTTSFTPEIIYTLSVNNVQDMSSNPMLPAGGVFSLYYPETYDVQINEIMADPDPPMSLPNFEYLELYNRTQFPINLKNWTLSIGGSAKVFPDVIIQPDSFLIITSTSGASDLSSYGQTISLSSFSLTNTGQTLLLSDSTGKMIHYISYTDDWYHDSYKMNGGWSLEQIDPLNPCGGSENWRASISPTGGTPGGQNSVNASNPDLQKPELVRVSIIDTFVIEAFFSESLDITYLQNVSNFTIDNGIGVPLFANAVSPQNTSVILTLSSPIQVGTVYFLTVTDTLLDCVGNSITVNSKARFAFPQTPVVNDIVINELLSNPTTTCVDFVEIYNRSQKVIDMKDLVLSTYDTISLVLDEIKEISSGSYLVFPGDYLVLTTDQVKVKASYTTLNPNNFVEMVSLPGFNNDDGTCAISMKNGTGIIDKFAYTADMFLPLLNSTDGVSLERINFNRPSNDKTNWHCAAETVGFATPTYKNSQYSEGIVTEDPVSVSPEVFSPDNDGYNDVLNLNYIFDTPGYIATITIYDANGRLIRELIKSNYLGTSGTFSWDGITDDNEKARIGIYVIYFEVFDVNGNVKHYKKTAVLAGKL